ncbi:CdaR family protein [Gracilibacillus sp. YIM 98692]|uniref:CdaR family protein n=1 Tax=Gracilibacillus sp. YIM 98692 TaxID=2663532 RepID=UPI0013CFB213|nr:CdaR family protein [Gracilibacillus sp. YIM 98692]
MNKWLEKTWAIRVVALVLAVLLFAVVAFDERVYDNEDGYDSPFGTTNETQTLDDIPVRAEIDQEKYVVRGVPDTVTVTLQGSVSLVTSTTLQRNFEIFVDLEDLGTGTHMVPLEHSGIANRINVYIEPQEVEVTVEERATKDFDVTMDIVNRDQMEAGYEVANIYAEPEQVTVTSSKSIVDRVAIVKAFVDVAGAGEPHTVDNVPVKVYDNQGNELSVRIDPPTVDVTLDVKNPHKTVPISLNTTNSVPDGYRITSMELKREEVEVYASESFLEGLSEIGTTTVDLSEITENQTIEVGLALPSEVRKVNSKTVQVEVQVEEIEERTLENISIETEDPGNTGRVQFLEPSTGMLDVTVKGYPSSLENINKSDIRLYVSVGNRDPGEYELDVQWEEVEDVEVELEIDQARVSVE